MAPARPPAEERSPADPGGASRTFDRETVLARMAREELDVVVVGGGITGAGVALDAAARGLRTALVERADFASGTSSRSSKMVHGGIRYLQQHDVALVYESLAERQRLLQNAPHLVSPLPFLIPLFGRDGVVSKTVARTYSMALWIYDLTGGLRIGRRHRRVGAGEALRHLPTLRVDRLVAGFLYFDAQADDARLTLTVLRTAAEHGALVANYAAATGLVTGDDGRICGIQVTPQVPGAGGEPAPFTLRARVVVNATGVWAEQVQALDPTGERVAIRPAKGVHVTVPAARLPADIAAVIPVPHDRRSIFVVPWPDSDFVYIGTTDTEYQGTLDDPACTPDDVTYLLDAVNAVTTSALTPDDVTGVWAGLRPLLAPTGEHELSERTADLSRRHSVRTSPEGLVTVTGGKLTTYRKMAEDAVHQAAALLEGPGPHRSTGATSWPSRLADLAHRPRSVTRTLRLHGAPRRGPVPPAMPGLPPDRQAHLVGRYGTDAPAVAALGEGRPALWEPLVPGLPYLGVEVAFAARAEMAQTLADALSRRTRAALQDARAALAAAPAAAAILGDELGWDAARAEAEVARFRTEVLHDLELAGLPEGPGTAGAPSVGEHA